MSAEKQIIEKFDGLWRLIIAFFSLPMIALLVIALLSRKIFGVEVILAVWIFFYLVIKLFQRLARQDKQVWFLVDDGLRCTCSSGKQEAIPWSQIKSMNYMSYVGLFIKCNKVGSQGRGKVLYEDVNVILSIDKNEAKELFQLWRGASPQHQDKLKRLKRAASRPDQRRAAGAIFVGFLGLALTIMELSSKKWLLAILWGLTSATAFTLGIGTGNAKFSGKKGLLIRNLLILLLGGLFFYLLIAGNRK